MFLARVIGSVVSTKKDPAMTGRKLLLLRPMLVDESDPGKFRPGSNTIVRIEPNARPNMIVTAMPIQKTS